MLPWLQRVYVVTGRSCKQSTAQLPFHCPLECFPTLVSVWNSRDDPEFWLIHHKVVLLELGQNNHPRLVGNFVLSQKKDTDSFPASFWFSLKNIYIYFTFSLDIIFFSFASQLCCGRCHLAVFEDLNFLRVYFYKDPTKITVHLSSCSEPGAIQENRISNSCHWEDLKKPLICLINGAGEEKSSDVNHIMKGLKNSSGCKIMWVVWHCSPGTSSLLFLLLLVGFMVHSPLSFHVSPLHMLILRI